MDTLMRTKKLESLGFERHKAEGLVQMVKESIEYETVKKSDLEKTELVFKNTELAIKNDIKILEVSLRGELTKVESSLNARIDKVESSLNARIDKVESTIKLSNRNLILYLGGLMISLFTLSLGFLVFLDSIKSKLGVI